MKRVFTVFLLLLLCCSCNRYKTITPDEVRRVDSYLYKYIKFWLDNTIDNGGTHVLFVIIGKDDGMIHYNFIYPEYKTGVETIRQKNRFYITSMGLPNYDDDSIAIMKEKSLFSKEYTINNVSNVQIFSSAEIQKAANLFKTYKGLEGIIRMGPFMYNSIISDAYIRIYIEKKNYLVYWPILKSIYYPNQEGVDYETVNEFNHGLRIDEKVLPGDKELTQLVKSGIFFEIKPQ